MLKKVVVCLKVAEWRSEGRQAKDVKFSAAWEATQGLVLVVFEHC